MPITRKPTFISFVGTAPQTDRLYIALEAATRQECPEIGSEFLGNPFEHYPTMRIDEKPKHDYSPPARTFFRLGLFYEFNKRVVKPAFEQSLDLVIVRQYGYDLYSGATEYEDCEKSLKIHKDLIPYTVLGLDLCPPLYVFTEAISSTERVKMDRYFAEGSGQSKCELEPKLPMADKIHQVIALIQSRTKRTEESKVA